MPDNPLIVLAGPTGSGKTALSLRLADEFEGEVISCDSVAVYRDFEIGTAKPSREERARVPHHMIDVASPDTSFTAGEYMRQAREAAHAIAARGKVPFVTGGTGLYLRAFLEGLFPGPPRQEELRERLQSRIEARGSAYLHRILSKLDASSAAAIHRNDAPKIIRALELRLTSRKPMSEWIAQGRDPLTGFRITQIGLNPPREALYERINLRCRMMFESGLVTETAHLLREYAASAAAPNLPINSLGYKQAAAVVRGEMTEADAVAATQQGHRNYAKRQLTWFRRDPNIKWFEGFGDAPEIERTVHVHLVKALQ